MSTQDEIFNAFIEKLVSNPKFPLETIGQLRILWSENELTSEDKILKAIEKGVKNGNED